VPFGKERISTACARRPLRENGGHDSLPFIRSKKNRIIAEKTKNGYGNKRNKAWAFDVTGRTQGI
jgi:hypothetical protein